MAPERDVLPTTVRASNYALSLYDLELSGAWTYQGTVKVDAEIKDDITEITLNSNRLKIHSASVQTEQGKTEGTIKSSNVSYDEKTQRATIHFDQTISQSHKAVLEIKFEGVINNDMCGFYRSKYKPAAPAVASVPKDDEFHYMCSTQFESCDARRAFPCFDEPNLKATFEFDIEIPEDQTALSNMDEKETRKGSKPGLKVVAFEKSPAMSTYLYAWGFGDFEYIEDFTKRTYSGKKLPVRVYTTKGLKEQGKLALESAHQIIDYFSDVFKIDYPLPKMDMLAVHEFSHGAMENWGLVTYRTTAILFDEAASDQKYKNRVVYVVAHELAHQWFGNLVTMDFWDELWLNEGFATWVGWLATDHLHPDWQVWAQFVTEGMQGAFALDALRTSHPIEVPIKNALDVDQIFDAISYLKGSSVIRMLAAHLTTKVFLDGVANYLEKYKYGNARTVDLWDALSKVSGEDVNALMGPWIQKIGFPVVTVAEEPGQITLRQSRFLSSGDASAEEDKTTWWVPLNLRSGSSEVKSQALSAKEDTIRSIDDDFYKINADQTGFYRANLPPQRLAKLSKQLEKLSVEDKIGLIGDAAALAASGDATTAGVLSFLEGFASEKSYLVWAQIISSLGNIEDVFADDKQLSEGFRKFILKLVSGVTEQIGWDFAPGDDFLTGQLRALLLTTAGLANHEPTVAEAQKQFKAFSGGDKKAIHPSLREVVLKIAIKHGGRAEYDAVMKEYETTTSVDGTEIALQALGRLKDPALIKEYIAWIYSGTLKLQDFYVPARTLGANPAARDILWHYIKDDWATVYGQLSRNMTILDGILKGSLSRHTSIDMLKEIEAFFKDKDTAGYDRGLANVSDSIKARAGYRQRDAEVIREWLRVHGYLE